MKGFVVLAFVVACSNPIAPVGDSLVRLDAPAIYRTWYSEVEACSGLKGDYDALVLRTARDIVVGGDGYSGYWMPPHTITIRVESVWLYNEVLIKHEFMHDVLQRGDHPAKYFNGVCGDLTVH